MKIINKLVERYGADKLLHYAVGGWLTAICSLFGWIGLLAGFILVVVLSFIKERLDDKRDKKDILAGVLGSLTMVIIYIIYGLC
mgnify:FL=1